MNSQRGTTDGPAPGGVARLWRGGRWVAFYWTLATVGGVAVDVLVTRLLAPDAAGAYFLIVSLVGAAALVAQLGLANTLVRFLGESLSTADPVRAQQTVRKVLVLALCGTLGVTVALTGGGHWIAVHVFDSRPMAAAMGPVVLWVLFIGFQRLAAEGCRGFHAVGRATLFGGALPNALTAVTLFTAWSAGVGMELNGVVMVSAAASMVAALAGGAWLIRRSSVVPAQALRPGTVRYRALITVAWPMLVSDLAFFVLGQMDLWVVGSFRAGADVALYGAAAQLARLVRIPLLLANGVLPPVIVDLHTRGRLRELEDTLRGSATLTILPSLLALVAIAVAPDSVMTLFYGGYYRHAGSALLFLAIGHVVHVGTGSCGYTLILTGHQRAMMKITLVTGGMTILGILLVVDRYGIAGVAAVAGAGMVAQNIGMLLGARRLVGVWTHARVPWLRRR